MKKSPDGLKKGAVLSTYHICDAAGRAVDPAELGDYQIQSMLADAFDTALRVEGVMKRDGIPWNEARQYV
ncbi:MAG: hypothetical protein LC676_18805 [Loktanella sp.]|nr:hypothetical protein [Loktanella sp.]